ncbi:MAG: hypothetical protein KAW81_04380 [Dehalococcoidia bacterium]|nr:hypothetical protein [Dehalococcoidia bacterium]
MDDFMYSQLGQTKEHAEGPYIIPDCIAIHVNEYMQAVGLETNRSRSDKIFDRLVDYSEWLEDHFSRGLDSVQAIVDSFVKEHEDLHPDDTLESLKELKGALLKVVSGLDLAISQLQARKHNQ